ncbi:aspartyl protease [Blastocystis sp. subtype 4]|uniref:aspartyl protease n=1 Tax=Blastocystis sp. subtype 4 TaxID=944170 RepID=UPI000711BAFE|nr:aspartyl protease [Blastocystis sp. subtype 4]KNB42061.1 aspartyl protease [Blastocystis sp. subtype 4]|eukprot:XP_014525504.1 aspartyl protease [Blastocystis sp. subtype 4]
MLPSFQVSTVHSYTGSRYDVTQSHSGKPPLTLLFPLDSCNRNCRYPSYCQKRRCCDVTSPSLCGFYLSYLDGSTAEGALYGEVMSLETIDTSSPLVFSLFGSIAKQTGQWDSFTDGLMGWSYGGVRGFPTVTSTWLEELVSQYKVTDSFSLCFGRSNGILTVGGYDERMIEGDIYWMDNQDPYYYVVRLNDVQINQKSVSMLKSIRAVIDSGTTLTLFPKTLFNKFKQLFMKQYPSLPTLSQSPNILDGAYVLTSRPSSDWPELQFYFDGVIVSIPPSVYFVSHLQDGKEAWLFGIQSFAGYVFFSISLSHSTSFSETHL